MEGREQSCEGGQVLPLLTLVVVLAGLVCLALGKLGGAAVARAQAVTAADAAALAGAAAGRSAAVEAAAANGGRVAGYGELGADALVGIELGGASATARARAAGGHQRGGGPGPAPAPAMRSVLARAGQLLGRSVPVVAPGAGISLPGDAATRHQRGLAVDVPAAFVATLAPVAAGAGLCQPYPQVHPVHFEICGYRLP